MGISERKEREKQEMKDRIISAAMDMFVTEGYEKTSIRAIAEKIEYSPATIYLYYKDKDELLYDVQSLAFERLLHEFSTNAVSKSPWKRLEQISETYIHFGLTQPDLYALMFIIKSPMNSIEEHEAWKNGESAFAFLLSTLQECIDKELLRYKDAATAALSIWSITHGLLSLNVCCRLKVMHLHEDNVEPIIYKSVKEYLRLIKA